jgi:hypothetical protein
MIEARRPTAVTMNASSQPGAFVAKFSPDGKTAWMVADDSPAAPSSTLQEVTGQRVSVDDLGQVYLGGTFRQAATLGAHVLGGNPKAQLSISMFLWKLAPQ